MQLANILTEAIELVTELLHLFGDLGIGHGTAAGEHAERGDARQDGAQETIGHHVTREVEVAIACCGAGTMQRDDTACNGFGDEWRRQDTHRVRMPTAHSPRRRAQTLLELMLVLLIIGLSTLIMLRELHFFLDRMEARNAVRAAGQFVARARDEAITQQTPMSVRIDTAAGTLQLLSRTGGVAQAPVGSMHRVTLSTTRDSIAFDVRGLGFGPANLTLVARRGAAAETLVVSRLGRVRY